jgi:hypothetical protein
MVLIGRQTCGPVRGESVASFIGEERYVVWSYVDDLEALLEKLIGFIRKVVLNTVLGGAIGLVDVNPACWAAELAGDIADIGGCAANCVVKDENARCSSAVEKKVSVRLMCC